jgi:hypothetical protein
MPEQHSAQPQNREAQPITPGTDGQGAPTPPRTVEGQAATAPGDGAEGQSVNVTPHPSRAY